MGHNQNQNPQLFVKLSLMWAGSKGVDMEAGADDEVILSKTTEHHEIVHDWLTPQLGKSSVLFLVYSQLERAAPVLWTVLQEWQTRIVKGSCNPLFGDKFSCILHKKLDDIKLKMEVL